VHNQIGASAFGEEVGNGGKVVVAQVAEDLGFTPERLKELAALFPLSYPVLFRLRGAMGAAGGVNIGAHLFDGDERAITLGVFGLVDRAHATAAYDAQNPVAPAQHIA